MAAGIAALPDDVLADVLRPLPARSLAAARCVCTAWRGIVNGRALLRRHLLPRAVFGVFINYIDYHRPHLFARPRSSSSATFPARVDGMLRFLPKNLTDWWHVLDHCNGLLLCHVRWERELCVCNPATRRCTVLPRSSYTSGGAYHYHLTFDPAASPHYEVVVIPAVPEPPSSDDIKKAKEKAKQERLALEREREKDAPFCLDWFFALPDGTTFEEEEEEEEDAAEYVPQPSADELLALELDTCRLMEWPPSPWMLRVFSSATGHWEERAFVREGMAVGTVREMRFDPEVPTYEGPRRPYAVYHDGSLYVHCRGCFVARFSLSNGSYQIIKTPANIANIKPYLGKLNKNVCFGIVHDEQLKIWILNESCGKMEWVMKCEAEVGDYSQHLASIPYNNNGRQPSGSWTIEEDYIDKMQDIKDDVESTEDDVESTEDEAESTYGDAESTDDDVETTDDDVETEKSYEWDSDNDDTFTANLENQDYIYNRYLDIIGFHPYKEVVFLDRGFLVVAYDLNSSKIHFLGNSCPKSYGRRIGIYESFLYTPCMVGDLLQGNETSQSSSCMVVGTVREMRFDPEVLTYEGPRRRYAVYHDGSLYMHCRGCFVARFSLPNGNYQIIKTPANIENIKPYLGKLNKNVCFGIVYDEQLKIWILNESCGKMEWILKCEVEVGDYSEHLASIPYYNNGRQHGGSWTVEEDYIDKMQDTKDNVESTDDDVESTDDDRRATIGTHNDDTFTVNLENQDYIYNHYLDIIGFHPYKEVVFLKRGFLVVAYDLNSFKIHFLGNSCPKSYDHICTMPCKSATVARCVVHKAWRDTRALLRPSPYLVPRSVHGIFINYVDHDRPHLFARPVPPSSPSSPTVPRVDGMLSFLPNDHTGDWWSVLDHCNGLLLRDLEWESQLCV
ncbi:hypothetical protein U9M48_030628 [Paspalum notatum var. saurae]|uniref:F-box domain-containing protein n=1 Tax=Paspalum notatum var. saurae TaxID=547442 RepID=A0AAQ3X3G1_PASNO